VTFHLSHEESFGAFFYLIGLLPVNPLTKVNGKVFVEFDLCFVSGFHDFQVLDFRRGTLPRSKTSGGR